MRRSRRNKKMRTSLWHLRSRACKKEMFDAKWISLKTRRGRGTRHDYISMTDCTLGWSFSRRPNWIASAFMTAFFRWWFPSSWLFSTQKNSLKTYVRLARGWLCLDITRTDSSCGSGWYTRPRRRRCKPQPHIPNIKSKHTHSQSQGYLEKDPEQYESVCALGCVRWNRRRRHNKTKKYRSCWHQLKYIL